MTKVLDINIELAVINIFELTKRLYRIFKRFKFNIKSIF